LRHALACVLRSVWQQGVRGKYRKAYWRFLGQVIGHAPRRFARAISLAIAGEHLIRYTAEEVLPRLDGAIAEVGREDAAAKAVWAHSRRAPRHAAADPVLDIEAAAV
jgi:hypothetical protein